MNLDLPCEDCQPCCGDQCPVLNEDDYDQFVPEMRRYLYRNVEAGYRKDFADFHKMPDVRWWT